MFRKVLQGAAVFGLFVTAFLSVLTVPTFANHNRDISVDDIEIRVLSRNQIEITFPDVSIYESGAGVADTTTTYDDLFSGTYSLRANPLEDDRYFGPYNGSGDDTADFELNIDFLEIVDIATTGGYGPVDPEIAFGNSDFFARVAGHRLFGDDGIDFNAGNIQSPQNFNTVAYWNGETFVSLVDGTPFTMCSDTAFAISPDGAQDPCLEDNAIVLEIPNQTGLDGDGTVTAAVTADGNGPFQVQVAGSGNIVAENAPDTNFSNVAGPEPSCEASNPIGWIVCPVARWFINFLDESIGPNGLIGSILNFSSLDDGTAEQDALRAIWTGFRTIANVGFVIAFFILVYSAASGGVLSAYDVKRLAPKLVVGAVLVQLSFFICLQLVTVFNALGDSVAQLMLAPIGGGASAADVFSTQGSGLGGFLNDFVSAIVLLLIIVGAAMSIGGILLMLAVFILRNMALVVLTVVSPLAFVAWILPNTESLFKRWWGLYIQLLALFPITVAFLSAGRLVAYVWTQGGSTSFANQWIGLIATFLPYLMAPKLFSFAGSAVNGLVRGINEGRQNLRERGGKLASTRAGQRARSGEAFGGGRRGTALRAITNPRATRANPLSGDRDRSAAAARRKAEQLENEDVDAARVNQRAGRASARQNAAVNFDQNGAAQVREAIEQQVASGQLDLEGDALEAHIEASIASARNSAQDAGEVGYLRQELGSGNAERQRAAAKTLLDVHSNDGEVVADVSETIANLKRSGNRADAQLADRLIEDNLGIAGAVPQVFKPNSQGTIAGLDAGQRNGLKSGSLEYFLDGSDAPEWQTQAGQDRLQANRQQLAEFALQDLSSGSTKGQVKDSNLETIVQRIEAQQDRVNRGVATADTVSEAETTLALEYRRGTHRSLDERRNGVPLNTSGGVGSAPYGPAPPPAAPPANDQGGYGNDPYGPAGPPQT